MSEHRQKEEWYGKLPPAWSVERIKAIFKLKDERSYLPLEEVNLISVYSKIGVMQHSDIEHTTGNKARNADGYKVVSNGDIIVNILLCWMGAIGCSEYNGVTSPAYDVYTPRENINSKYYHYLFRLPAFSGECYKVGKGIMSMRWRTYSPQFTNIVVPVPSCPEQDQIVRFLDWKVSAINRLIGVKQKQIASLRDFIQAEIERLLCAYPMKEKKRLKQLGTFFKGGGFSRDNLVEDNGYPAILYGDIYTQYKYETSVITHHIDGAAYNASRKISKGDIVMAGTGETKDEIGKSILYIGDETVAVGGDVIVFHPSTGINVEYLLYQLYSQASLKHRYINGKGDIIVHIYPLALGNTIIMLPNEDEQKEVVSRINEVIGQVKKATTVMREEIDVLREYKIRLISDVVIGKIDVRGIEIPEYEYVEEDDREESDTDGEDRMEEEEFINE